MHIHSFTFLKQTLVLHPYKAIYWQDQKILLLADLHLGKVNHFRKAGIAVPGASSYGNWGRLTRLLKEFNPERVLFLGDLFHSSWNQEWDQFINLLKQYPDIHFELVVGNHDILSAKHYDASRLTIHHQTLTLEPFLFSHQPLTTDEAGTGLYNLSGHIHPAVKLRGQARQTLRLPCFYFGSNGGILPAFGHFTGLYIIKPKAKDKLFAIADQEIASIPTES